MGTLGSCLLDNDTIDDIIPYVTPETFYRDAHILIFRGILDVYQAQGKVDTLLLADELTRNGTLDRVGGIEYLAEVMNSVPHAANGKHYAGIVRQKALARRLIEAASTVLEESYSNAFTAEDLIDRAERSVFGITELERPDHTAMLDEATALVIDRIEAIQQGRRTSSGDSTGWPSLDEIIDGLHPERMVVIAGRPAMGKTIAALNIAQHMSVTNGKPTLYACLEMNRVELGQRVLSSMTGVWDSKLKDPTRLNGRDFTAIGQGLPQLKAAPLAFDDYFHQTALGIAASARRLRRRFGSIGLIVVDYLQLVSPDDTRESRQEQVARMSRAFKTIAREMQCPLIVLSQLNREVEKREDRRPRMSDLRESGAIEQDADQVILLHRPEYYEPNDSPGIVELIVSKNRHGSSGTVKLIWEGHCYRMVEAGASLDDFGPPPEQPQDIEPRPLPPPSGSAGDDECGDE